ncbi:hypothetical protein [Cobetia amphilecti]|uniref:Uncharacterized protein n=1 Tax=Cobetia amphilecti TaxID=1055104 RepID=A0AAP4TXI3_9GAMM|nr:hypothetical protein [Cobetia amphilecti]MDO6671515.1 hypothetical protein [Cobetia amphilecti]
MDQEHDGGTPPIEHLDVHRLMHIQYALQRLFIHRLFSFTGACGSARLTVQAALPVRGLLLFFKGDLLDKASDMPDDPDWPPSAIRCFY